MQTKKPLDLPCSPVVVVGAGAAGMACALATARHGKEVVLVEKTSGLGGTVKQALIHTLGGLFDDQGELLNQGLSVELCEKLFQACSQTKKRRIGKTWVLDVDPDIYTQVVTDWITATANITVYSHAEINRVVIEDKTVKQVIINRNNEIFTVNASALIDTTGSAEVVRQIDVDLVDEGMALGGYILQLRNVEPGTLKFPKGVALLRDIRRAAEQGQLSQECATVWLDSGVYADEVYAKFSVSMTDYQPEHMQMVASQLMDYLRHLPGFGTATLHAHSQLGIRDGGRIHGEYCLTAADVVSGKQFEDAVCQASWPIEHWHPDKGITLEYLPPGSTYTIPLRSLKVAGFSNLWAIGKCLSAEPRAQASARVVGTCWAMGAAVGKNLVRSYE